VISKLSLNNFKAFEDEVFDLGRLNILSGLNSSGKSSVIQAIRLLQEKKPLPELGPLVQYIRSDMKGFRLECEQIVANENDVVAFSYERGGKLEGKSAFSGIVSYISADRLGPRTSLPLSIDKDIATVGIRGEYIVDFLTRLDNDWDDLTIPGPLIVKEGNGVNANIREWLRFISPGINFEYKSDNNTDLGQTVFNKHRPVHVGFGLSYTLPVIASILIHASQLAAKKTESVLLLLENPEAHLHPSGQTKIGEMLALAAACGVQIVVETHSDHLMNGIRIAIKDKKIDHADVKAFFFKKDSTDDSNEEPVTVESPDIDEHGMLDFWPEGFFDETEKNLMRLI